MEIELIERKKTQVEHDSPKEMLDLLSRVGSKLVSGVEMFVEYRLLLRDYEGLAEHLKKPMKDKILRLGEPVHDREFRVGELYEKHHYTGHTLEPYQEVVSDGMTDRRRVTKYRKLPYHSFEKKVIPGSGILVFEGLESKFEEYLDKARRIDPHLRPRLETIDSSEGITVVKMGLELYKEKLYAISRMEERVEAGLYTGPVSIELPR